MFYDVRNVFVEYYKHVSKIKEYAYGRKKTMLMYNALRTCIVDTDYYQ